MSVNTFTQTDSDIDYIPLIFPGNPTLFFGGSGSASSFMAASGMAAQGVRTVGGNRNQIVRTGYLKFVETSYAISGTFERYAATVGRCLLFGSVRPSVI